MSRFIAVANNMVKHNKGGRFNKELSFTWEMEAKAGKLKSKETSQEEMSRIAAYWNKIFQNQVNANGRN